MASKLNWSGEILVTCLLQIVQVAFSDSDFLRQLSHKMLSNSLALEFLPEFYPPRNTFLGSPLLFG